MTAKTLNEPSDRAPALPLSTIAIALVVFLGAVAALEVLAASRGIEARPADGVGGWVRMYRDAASDPDGIILIGSSRTALGVDPIVLSESSGRAVYNLSIDGGNPLPVAERLAADRYPGTLLIELMERRLFSEDERGRETVAAYLHELDNPSLLSGVEDRVRTEAARRFRTRSVPMRLLNLVRSAMSLRLPTPAERYNRPDRFEYTDVGRVDGAELEGRWAEQAADVEPFSVERRRERATEIAGLSQTLEAGGARVLWMRLPSSGRVREVEDAAFPRSDFYELVGGPSVRWHYADDPRTRELTCFDGSHLSPADAVVLSETLGEWLRAQP